MLVLVIASFLFLLWFTFFSYFARTTRWATFGITSVVVGLLILCLRLQGFTGNMVPIMSFRPWLQQLAGIHEQPELQADDELTETFTRVDLRTRTPLDFPQFLGPHRDLSVTAVKLARDWSANPPQEIWRQPIGAGWSGFAVVNGSAVTLEQRGMIEMVRCYDVETGKLQWSHGTRARFATIIAGTGPRSTPTIHAGRVYTLGGTGILQSLDGETGQAVWTKDIPKEMGGGPADEASLVAHGRANSPLIVEDLGLVVIPAGGARDGPRWSLAAFHQDNGALVWKGGDHNVSYSSPVLATLAGKRQILIVSENELTGHDPATGAVLWRVDWPGITSQNANASQAVPVPPDRVFVSKGYGGGALLFQLLPKDDGTFDPKEIYHKPRAMRTKLTNVTMKDGYVYGLSDGVLECMELETGKIVWRDGAYGHGQILRVNDLLLVLSEEGELTLVEVTPERANNVLGQIQALNGRTWNNLALYGPYLLVRNGNEAACYKLATE